MKRTQRKDALRNIWKQRVSYLSIIVIAFLGVTSFLGITYSAAALKRSGSATYNEANFRDIEIVSTLLLSGDDLREIRAAEGVADVEAVRQTSVKAAAGDKRQDASVISLTERVNLPQLVEGCLPANAAECAVEQGLMEDMGWRVGDVIELTSAGGGLPQYLLGSEYEIVGVVLHPDHVATTVPETLYILVTPDAFDAEALDDCFMKAEVVIEKAPQVDRFGEEYEASVAAVQARLEELAGPRASERDAAVHTRYQTEIDENQSELDKGREKLEDARTELDEGWKALSEGERELSDGETRLSDAKEQLEEAWQQLLDAQKQLEEADSTLASAKSQLSSKARELDAGHAQLVEGRKELIETFTRIEDAKSTIRDLIRGEIEDIFGSDVADSISWASRTSVDPDSAHATAMEFWITEKFKFDLNRSLSENITDFIYSGEIPDEVLIAAYENLTGGGM